MYRLGWKRKGSRRRGIARPLGHDGPIGVWSNSMELKTPLCAIRPYRPDDLDALVKHANDPLVASQLRDRFPNPYTRDDGRLFLETAAASHPLESFAIVVGSEAVGGIGVHPGSDVTRASAEVGYWLGRAYWGRGIATAALGAVANHVLGSGPYCRLNAHAFEGNLASQRVLEKCGFVKEGVLRYAVLKNGRLYDMVLYGRVEEAAVRRVLSLDANQVDSTP
jgi:ribosomal-protein-alanine N-acetyltransferase